MRRYNIDMDELRQKRKDLGLTQAQAANACGVSRRTYQTYEEDNIMNETALKLYKQLEEMGIIDGTNYISNVKKIKYSCAKVFSEKYPEVECAYLFGSYARGEARGDSDIDILIVCPAMGLRFYGIVSALEEELYKKVDLHTHREFGNNEEFLAQLLKDGIKIYDKYHHIKN